VARTRARVYPHLVRDLRNAIRSTDERVTEIAAIPDVIARAAAAEALNTETTRTRTEAVRIRNDAIREAWASWTPQTIAARTGIPYPTVRSVCR
jgi:hypothetical protein